MSSDYDGSVAGEIADRAADTEQAFLAWLDVWARRDPAPTLLEDLHAAFMAGAAAAAGTLPDPDIIRGIERVTGETYRDGTWHVS